MRYKAYNAIALEPDGSAPEYPSDLLTWPLIWRFVCAVCPDIVTSEDVAGGLTALDHRIDRDKALAIADRLEKPETLALASLVEAGCEAMTAGDPNFEGVDNALFLDVDIIAFGDFCHGSGGFDMTCPLIKSWTL